MAFKALTQEKIDELTAKTDEFARQWEEKGYPEITDEDLKGMYLNVSKYFPDLDQSATYDGIPTLLDEIYNLEWLTVDDILNQTNIETRRLYISSYGTHRFLRDGGTVPVTDEDTRGYQVVKFPVDGDSWYFLKMVNSTLEPGYLNHHRPGVVDGGLTPDGFKIYFLRLPSEIIKNGKITNEEAVAWSFRSKPLNGYIYKNNTNEYLEKSRDPNYDFSKDKREFTLQGRQGDVQIRLLALSMEDLLNGKFYTEDGYDPETYRPDVES